MTSIENFDEAVLSRLRSPYKAVMLFGSTARQSPADDSDIDILQLVLGPEPSYKDGQLSVSVYSYSALKELALQGSLFVLHLRLEGRVIYDPEGLIKDCLGYYRQVQNYGSFLGELRELSRFLDMSPGDYAARATSLNQLAIFILRSALFAILARQGRPHFAMNQVAESFEDPAILRAYSLKQMLGPNADLFGTTKSLIEKYLDFVISNPFGSYEALLVNCSGKSQFVRSVALHFLKRFSGIEGYGFFKDKLDGPEDNRR